MKPKKSRAANQYTPQGHDLCQTPAYALDPLLPYIAKDKTIWEPAAGEGLLAGAIESAGHSVVTSELQRGQNFFQYQPPQWDVLVTNPPYTIKFKWMARCYELGKPFALLIPGDAILAASAQILMQRYGYEIMLLDKRVDFKMPEKGWEGSGAQFSVIWFCWKLLPEQVMFGKLVNKPRKGRVKVHPDQPMLWA